MGKDTRIEWADHTINPWRGCTKVSPACANCYAEKQAKRNPSVLGIWGDNGIRVVAAEAAWREPLKWDRDAEFGSCIRCKGKPDNAETGCTCRKAIRGEAPNTRPRVFCASMADVFEDWHGPMLNHKGERMLVTLAGKWTVDPNDDCPQPLTMADVRDRLFTLIDATPNLDWLLLTKRPENIAAMMPRVGFPESGLPGTLGRYLVPPNVWLGTTVENQQTADERIPHLLRVPAAVRFLSCEPILGAVDLSKYLGDAWECPECGDDDERGKYPMKPKNKYCGVCAGDNGRDVSLRRKGQLIHWVIAGGESGPHARPSHPDWFRSLRDQCVAARVAFHFKQWGEIVPESQVPGLFVRPIPDHMVGRISWPFKFGNDFGPSMARIGKNDAGRTLDGRTWDEFPEVRA